MESVKSVNVLSVSNKAQPKLAHRVVDGIKATISSKNAPETKTNCLRYTYSNIVKLWS